MPEIDCDIKIGKTTLRTFLNTFLSRHPKIGVRLIHGDLR